MAKELYLYSPIYDFVAAELLASIEENMGSDITLRENTPGGSVFSAYGIYSKVKEHGNVHLKVDGSAMSGGAFLPLYVKSSECLDVSRFMLHRADMYVEDGEDQAFLDSINKDLKAQMKAKIDEAKFKDVTGYTIDELFNPETRLDIYLTGKQAKEIGLVDKVVKLTPEMQKAISAFNNKMYNVAAMATEPNVKNSNIKNMTADEIKQQNPAVYAEILALGVAQERDRVEACMVYNDIDPVAVKKAIESGKPLSQKEMAELNLKAVSGKLLTDVTTGAAPAVNTPEVPAMEKTAEEKELEDFNKQVTAHLKIK